MFKSNIEKWHFYPKKRSPHKTAHDQPREQSKSKIEHLAHTYLLICYSHLISIQHRPSHHLIYHFPLIPPDLSSAHCLELLRVVQMSCRFLIAIIDQICVFSLSISEEIEGFFFESNKHPTITYEMIQCIDQIQVSVNERLDHLTTLLIDSEQLAALVRDQEKRRVVVKNFRVIKASEKSRINNQIRYLKQMEKITKSLTKTQIIACEQMLANCINQYINSDYEVRKSGEPNDLIDLFLFYYRNINFKPKIVQLTVIKNCQLMYELNFMTDNLGFLLNNMQTSLNHIYETEKNKFLELAKLESRSISPEKREDQEEQKFDTTGKLDTKAKRKLQQYCFQLSKMLDLQSLYVNYFYFNSMDTQKRKRALTSNFMKRNLHIKRLATTYEAEYKNYREKHKK